MKISLLILVFSGFTFEGFSQINIPLLHQLVSESKSEHKVQTTARNRQAEVSANEELNKSKMAKLKEQYRDLKARFHSLGLAIDAVQIGIKATPIINEIKEQQSIIYSQAQQNPLLLPLALETEKDLVNSSRLLLNYLIGLCISLGDVNQMKPSDRKMLFSHVIDELRVIAGTSKGLAVTLTNANRKMSLNPFSNWINEDKRLVNEIKRKIAVLKNN